jgi:hypothetical protein
MEAVQHHLDRATGVSNTQSSASDITGRITAGRGRQHSMPRGEQVTKPSRDEKALILAAARHSNSTDEIAARLGLCERQVDRTIIEDWRRMQTGYHTLRVAVQGGLTEAVRAMREANDLAVEMA